MSKKSLIKVTVAILLLVVVLTAAAAAFRMRKSTTTTDYYTAVVVEGPLAKTVNATGVVQTVVTVPVGSQVSGQVQELFADFNSVVKRGQLLAKLDPRNLESAVTNAKAQLASAQARLRSAEAAVRTDAANVNSSKASLAGARVARDNAKQQLDRASQLNQKGLQAKNEYETAQANYDSAVARYEQAVAALEQVNAQNASTEAGIAQARAGLQQAEAELDRTQVNLEYANIFSPVDGIVISRDVDVGQTIAASMSAPTLFSIATDLSEMQVKASVDEADIGSISEDAKVTFTVDSYPNTIFNGRIAEIRLNPQTVQNVVTYSVILSIQNKELRLKPGMTASIKIVVAERDKVLKLPNSALRYHLPGTPAPSFSDTMATEDAAKAIARAGAGVSLPQAPGQRWNPIEKLRFATIDRNPQHEGTAFILGPDKKPLEKKLMLGITDGAMTELISGDLKAGDEVIVGDGTQPDTQNQVNVQRGQGQPQQQQQRGQRQ
jgi:HlyD family secretion protein